MWWECSECGGRCERPRPPSVCEICGTAGVIFMEADADEDSPSGERFRDSWLLTGMAWGIDGRGLDGYRTVGETLG